MKKYKLPILVGVVIGLTVAVYFSQSKPKEKLFNAKESEFAVTDTSKIDMLFIADRKGKKNKFTKQDNGRWLVNDEYISSDFMIKMLLGTISQMKVKSKVSESARNNVIKDLSTNGIKVEVYSNKELLKIFYVGSPTSDDLGTYFIMEGSENPYVVHIPGFNGFLSTRFDIKKEDWKDRIYFSTSKSEIDQLSINYNSDSLTSFEISNINGEFTLSDLDNIDSLKIQRYLAKYMNVSVTRYIEKNNEQIVDSLQNTTPFCVISLKKKSEDQPKTIKLFSYVSNKEYIVGLTQKNEAVYVQAYQFEPLLVNKSFFKKVDVKL